MSLYCAGSGKSRYDARRGQVVTCSACGGRYEVTKFYALRRHTTSEIRKAKEAAK